MKTNWIVAIKNAIADLITRTKGLDDVHDDLGTHETAQATHRTALGTHDTDIKALLTTVQADLDNPDQYKAAVAALALEATLTAIKGAGWTDENLTTIDSLIDAIKAVTDKIPGSEADTQVAGLDLAAGPTEVFTISTTTRKKVHMLMVSMVNCSAAAKITVDLSTKINGVLTKFYSQEFTKDTDPDGIMVINGTLAILADLKVEMTSSDAGDNAVTVPYSYILEAME